MSSQFDWRNLVATAADYDARAQAHRPTDLRAEVLRLHGEGLRPRDIAQALRMNDADVITTIYGTTGP